MYIYIYIYISINKSRYLKRWWCPGLELVAFSRAKGPDCLAVGNNSNNLTIIKRALCHFTSSHSRGYNKIGSNQNGYRKNLQGWL